MKFLTSKNKMKFENYKELQKYIEDHQLICLGQVGNHQYSYINEFTHVNHAYAYDLYVSNIWTNTLIKHTKLKVYYQNNGGYYINSNGNKCWINSFFDNKHDILVTTENVIALKKKERNIKE